MDIYNAEKTYKQDETCLYEGIIYRASCGGAAIIGIPPTEDSIGTFWIVEEDTIKGEQVEIHNANAPFEEKEAQSVVHGLNP